MKFQFHVNFIVSNVNKMKKWWKRVRGIYNKWSKKPGATLFGARIRRRYGQNSIEVEFDQLLSRLPEFII